MTPHLKHWRDALIGIAVYFLLLAVVDPAPAAESHRVEERTMHTHTAPHFSRFEEATAALLACVGIEVSTDIVATWSERQLDAADAWAGATYLRAALPALPRPIDVPPMPGFLQPYRTPTTSVPGSEVRR